MHTAFFRFSFYPRPYIITDLNVMINMLVTSLCENIVEKQAQKTRSSLAEPAQRERRIWTVKILKMQDSPDATMAVSSSGAIAGTSHRGLSLHITLCKLPNKSLLCTPARGKTAGSFFSKMLNATSPRLNINPVAGEWWSFLQK